MEEARGHPRHHFVHADIADAAAMARVFAEYRPDAVMHLAAESHVDRAIDGPAPFIQTNIVGTYTLLEAARRYWETLNGAAKEQFRFHHVSTDEVFGTLRTDDPPFHEQTAYDPRIPYSASKAASDHLVRAWHHTYGLPTLVSNTTNNYGPWQFPEKLIPLVLLNALESKPLPIYGDGAQRRDWLYVEDHAAALLQVVERGQPGATYASAVGNPGAISTLFVRYVPRSMHRTGPCRSAGTVDLSSLPTDPAMIFATKSIRVPARLRSSGAPGTISSAASKRRSPGT